MECLTECTDAKRRKGYIAAATAEGKATLLTRAYGRGILVSVTRLFFDPHTHIVWDGLG